MFGLGEKAGLNIDAEQPGLIAEAPPADWSRNDDQLRRGLSMTPMELTAIVSAVANGGTLYYLQHPGSQAEIDQYVPQVKRQLNVAPWLTDIKPGMMGAVEYGTARRAGFSATETDFFGKTGTCTDNRSFTHLGWFGSYNEIGGRKLVVVVLLTSGVHSVSGPIASGVAARSTRTFRARTISLKPLRRRRRRLSSPTTPTDFEPLLLKVESTNSGADARVARDPRSRPKNIPSTPQI